jgi:hypothetical protein
VSLRVAVPAQWLNEGRTIEVELPRNLTCARCGGGGCSACGQSGAITVRGKTELPEVVQVALPLQPVIEDSEPATASDAALDPTVGSRSERVPESQPKSARPVVIRIPECGGLPDGANGVTVRGWLLLEIGIADVPSSNVRWLDDDDPLSSSKMLRAETRPNDKLAAGDEFRTAAAARSSHAPPQADDGGAPPSSRVHRVGSTVPPDRRVARAVERNQGLTFRIARRLQMVDAMAQHIYIGIAVLAILAILALIFL